MHRRRLAAGLTMLAVLMMSAASQQSFAQTNDYDADDDNLIEVRSLEQLNAIRYDLDGDGTPTSSNMSNYADAFPTPATSMGCPATCTGYELMADLDFDTSGDDEITTADGVLSWGSGFGWEPIGTNDNRFTAEFHGNDHTISHLFINRPFNTDFVGLFGDVGDEAVIRSVGLVGVDVTGDDYVGGLVGRNNGGTIRASYATGVVRRGDHHVGGLVGLNAGTIDASYATGVVRRGNFNVGGLVGYNNGTIRASYATGEVNGRNWVGGLVGLNNGGTIRASYATGEVEGGVFVGGLVGRSDGGIIRASYATGEVSGNNEVGGLVGWSNGTINASYATGEVGGNFNVGGLVGNNSRGTIRASYATGEVNGSSGNVGGLVGGNSGTIDASYATSEVNGSEVNGSSGNVGGLVGQNNGGTIRASYATGEVNGTDDVGGLVGENRGTIRASYATGEVNGGSNVGGLVGRNIDGTIIDSYFDTDTSGLTGSEGRATGELQLPTTYTGIYANWNVDLDDADSDSNALTGGDDPWHFGTSDQYPVLQVDFNGDGVKSWQEFGPNSRRVAVSPRVLSLMEGEAGTYTVVLLTTPTNSVTVTPMSDNPAVSVSGELTFSVQDWNVEQTVTVRAVNDDNDVDEVVSLTHTVESEDLNYALVTTPVVTVNVADSAPPTIIGISDVSLETDAAAGTEVSRFTVSDEDDTPEQLSTFMITLGGEGASLFVVTPATGTAQTEFVITLARVLARAPGHDLTLTVTANDGVRDSEEAELTVMVANLPPTALIAAPTTSSLVTGQVIMLDASGSTDTHTGGRIAGYEWRVFAGDARGDELLSTTNTATTEFTAPLELMDAQTEYVIALTVTDGNDVSSSTTIALTVYPVDLVNTMDSDNSTLTGSVNEGAGIGDVTGLAVAVQRSDGHRLDVASWSLSSTNSAPFMISSAGEVTVAGELDHETSGMFIFNVTAMLSTNTDLVFAAGAESRSEEVEVTIGDVDEPLTITDTDDGDNTIAENTTMGTVVENLVLLADDPDADNDVTSLTIDRVTAVGDSAPITNLFGVTTSSSAGNTTASLTVAAEDVLDHETVGSYDVTIVAVSRESGAVTATFTVMVTDVNEAPTVEITSDADVADDAFLATTDEAIQLGSVVMDQDVGDGHRYNWVATPPAGVTLSPSDGITTAFTAIQAGDYLVRLTVTDNGGLSAATMVTVRVGVENSAGICGRTRQVQNQILFSSSVLRCDDVTGSELASVLILFLRNGVLSGEDLQPGDFQGLSGLLQLALSRNGFTTLPDGIFSELVSLKHLGLSNNGLASLPDGIFSGLGNLRYLGLWSNELTTLPDGIFSDLTLLRYLGLEFNRLTSLSGGAFTGLTSLKELVLNGNGLSSLSADVFTGLVNLQDLLLHDNALTSLPAGVFTGLDNLRRLDLSGNPGLTSLEAGVFDDVLDTLRSLYLDDALKGTLSFSAPAAGLAPGAAAMVSVQLDRALPARVRVPYSVSFAGGAAGDFDGLADGALDFNAGETSRAVRVTASETATPGAVANLALGAPVLLDAGGNENTHFNVNDALVGVHRVLNRHTLIVSEPGLPAPSEITEFTAVDGSSVADGTAIDLILTLNRLALMGTPVTITYTIAETGDVAAGDIDDADADGDGDPLTGRIVVNPGSNAGRSTIAAADFSPGGMKTFTVSLGSLPAGLSLAGGEDGVATYVVSDICGRTRQVRDAIVQAAAGATTCGDVTPAHLAGITSLSLIFTGLQTLQAGDFAGLTNLVELSLNGNDLTSLPDDVFSGLTGLQELNLERNRLTELPAGIFNGLTNLRELRLINNSLTDLPAGVFTDLASLEDLRLQNNNSLTNVSDGVFTGLTGLEYLGLSNSGLTSLPDGVFDGLTGLEILLLSGNDPAIFPIDAFADLTRLEEFWWTPGSGFPDGLFDDVLDTLVQLMVAPEIRGALSFDQSVAELGQNAPVEVDVTLSRALPAAVRVSYALSFGGGADASHFSDDAGGVLTFTAGQTRTSVTVTAMANAPVDGTGRLTLGAPVLLDGDGEASPLHASALVVEGSTQTYTITVIPQSEDLRVSVAGGEEITEGGEIVFTVTLESITVNPVSIPYAIAGIDDGDVAPAAAAALMGGTVLIAAGTSSTELHLATTADGFVEGTETAVITLGQLPAGLSLAGASSASVSIGDSDRLSVSLSAAAYGFAEDAGSTEVAVLVRSASNNPVTLVSSVTVSVATNRNGAAAEGEDYTALNETVTIQPNTYPSIGSAGDRIAVEIEILDNTIVEPDDESFRVVLTAADGRVMLGAPNTATVTIDDNDVTAVLSPVGAAALSVSAGRSTMLTVTTNPVLEADESAILTLTLDGVADVSLNPAQVTLNGATTPTAQVMVVAGLQAAQSMEGVAGTVRVSAADGSGSGVHVNLGADLPLEVVPLQVAVTFAETGIELIAGEERTIGFEVSPADRGTPQISVAFVADDGITVASPVTVASTETTGNVEIIAGEDASPGLTANVTVDAQGTDAGRAQVFATNSLQVTVVREVVAVLDPAGPLDVPAGRSTMLMVTTDPVLGDDESATLTLSVGGAADVSLSSTQVVLSGGPEGAGSAQVELIAAPDAAVVGTAGTVSVTVTANSGVKVNAPSDALAFNVTRLQLRVAFDEDSINLAIAPGTVEVRVQPALLRDETITVDLGVEREAGSAGTITVSPSTVVLTAGQSATNVTITMTGFLVGEAATITLTINGGGTNVGSAQASAEGDLRVDVVGRDVTVVFLDDASLAPITALTLSANESTVVRVSTTPTLTPGESVRLGLEVFRSPPAVENPRGPLHLSVASEQVTLSGDGPTSQRVTLTAGRLAGGVRRVGVQSRSAAGVAISEIDSLEVTVDPMTFTVTLIPGIDIDLVSGRSATARLSVSPELINAENIIVSFFETGNIVDITSIWLSATSGSSGTVTVTANQNIERDGFFSVTLSVPPSQPRLTGVGNADVIVAEDSRLEGTVRRLFIVSFSQNALTLTHRQASLPVNVGVAAPLLESGEEITVTLTSSDPAVAVRPSSVTLTQGAQSTTVMIQVPFNHQSMGEVGTVALSVESTGGDDNPVFIESDDQPLSVSFADPAVYPAAVSTVRAVTGLVPEGGTVEIVIELDTAVPFSEEATISYQVSGDGVIPLSPNDDLDGSTGTATIAAEQIATTVRVGVGTDARVENTESGRLSVQGVVFTRDMGRIASQNMSAVFGILDRTTMSVSIAAGGAAEGFAGAAGTIPVTVSVANAQALYLDRDVNVALSFAADSAEEGADYTLPGPAMVTFTDNPQSASPEHDPTGTVLNVATAVVLVSDTLEEGDETFEVSIADSQQDTAVVRSATHTATATIRDNDLQVSVAGGGAITEGGEIIFTVTLTGAAAQSHPGLLIPYAIAGINGFDVPADAGKLTGDVSLGAGAASTELRLSTSPADDGRVEGPETAEITLGQLPAGLSLAGGGTASVAIGDSNRLSVSLSAANYGVAENAGSVQVAVLVNSTSNNSVTLVSSVTVSVATNQNGGVAAEGEDYTALNETVTIPPAAYPSIGSADNRIAVEIEILDNTIVEPDGESFGVVLTAADGRVTLGTDAATVTIDDNDVTAVLSPVGAANLSVSAGRSTMLTVTTEPELGAGETAILTLTLDGVADVSLNPAQVTLNGTTAQTAQVAVDAGLQAAQSVEGVAAVRVTVADGSGSGVHVNLGADLPLVVVPLRVEVTFAETGIELIAGEERTIGFEVSPADRGIAISVAFEDDEAGDDIAVASPVAVANETTTGNVEIIAGEDASPGLTADVTVDAQETDVGRAQVFATNSLQVTVVREVTAALDPAGSLDLPAGRSTMLTVTTDPVLDDDESATLTLSVGDAAGVSLSSTQVVLNDGSAETRSAQVELIAAPGAAVGTSGEVSVTVAANSGVRVNAPVSALAFNVTQLQLGVSFDEDSINLAIAPGTVEVRVQPALMGDETITVDLGVERGAGSNGAITVSPSRVVLSADQSATDVTITMMDVPVGESATVTLTIDDDGTNVGSAQALSEGDLRVDIVGRDVTVVFLDDASLAPITALTLSANESTMVRVSTTPTLAQGESVMLALGVFQPRGSNPATPIHLSVNPEQVMLSGNGQTSQQVTLTAGRLAGGVRIVGAPSRSAVGVAISEIDSLEVTVEPMTFTVSFDEPGADIDLISGRSTTARVIVSPELIDEENILVSLVRTGDIANITSIVLSAAGGSSETVTVTALGDIAVDSEFTVSLSTAESGVGVRNANVTVAEGSRLRGMVRRLFIVSFSQNALTLTHRQASSPVDVRVAAPLLAGDEEITVTLTSSDPAVTVRPGSVTLTQGAQSAAVTIQVPFNHQSTGEVGTVALSVASTGGDGNRVFTESDDQPLQVFFEPGRGIMLRIRVFLEGALQ